MVVLTVLTVVGSLHGIPESSSLHLMSFNVRRKGKEAQTKNLWVNRKARVAAAIKTVRPDIMGLQEATIDQIKDLDESLKSEQYAWFGSGRGSEWFGKSENEYNPIFYNTKRVECMESGTFVLNPAGFLNYRFFLNPKKVGLLTRICTWGKFRDKATGQVFYVYNTHLDHKYQAARVNELAAIAKAVRLEQSPVVLMGDFNMEITPDLLSALLKDFKNTKEVAQNVAGPVETRTGWQFEELKRIDHILVSKQVPVKVTRHMVLQEQNKDLLLSDHRPVLVDLIFERKQQNA